MHFEINKNTDVSVLISKIKSLIDSFETSNIIKTEIITIASELIYNIKKYTPHGFIEILYDNDKVQITAKDFGEGIKDLNHAMLEGYSTGGSLGLGLPAIIRFSDEFDAQTSYEGTTISSTKMLL